MPSEKAEENMKPKDGTSKHNKNNLNSSSSTEAKRPTPQPSTYTVAQLGEKGMKATMLDTNRINFHTVNSEERLQLYEEVKTSEGWSGDHLRAFSRKYDEDMRQVYRIPTSCLPP